MPTDKRLPASRASLAEWEQRAEASRRRAERRRRNRSPRDVGWIRPLLLALLVLAVWSAFAFYALTLMSR